MKDEQKFEIEIEKVIPEQRITVKYSRDEAERNLKSATDQMNIFSERYQKEIDFWQDIINQMDSANIVSEQAFKAELSE